MATTPAFYARVHVHVGASTRQVLAPFMQTLPTLTDSQKGTAYILQGDGVGRPDGLYLWTGKTWGYGIPFPDVADAISNAAVLHAYYDLTTSFAPAHALKFWQNGVAHSATSIPARLTNVWGTVDAQYAGIDSDQGGAVKTVNNISPDEQGNIELEQIVEYAISVTQTPDPGTTIFYQVFDLSLVLESHSISVKQAPTQDVVFQLILDGAPSGTMTLGPSGNDFSPSFTQISIGQVLEIVADPVSTGGLSQFSLNLQFTRS